MHERTRCPITKEMIRIRPMSKETCLMCKGGRMLCGLSFCPLLKRINIQARIRDKIKTELFGPTPPGVFVGTHGYPDVLAGPMVSAESESAQIADDPSKWYGTSIEQIINYRSSLVRSMVRHNVRKQNAFTEKVLELVLSTAPVDVETEFSSQPKFNLSFSPVMQPLGPSGMVRRIRVCGSPKIPKKVDAVLEEKPLAMHAINKLFSSGYDVYYLTKVLSAGVLGRERKLVPTRWSITATDDIASKAIMEKIKTQQHIPEFQIFSNEYLHNHFEILLLPGAWEFEQFEAWAPGTIWTEGLGRAVVVEEYEGWEGRKEYAMKEGGGYYAGRFAVCEALARMRKQAKAIVFREIHEGYVIPVGVWEVRENIRNAFRNPPTKFSTLKEALAHLSTKLRIPLNVYMKKSRILGQTRLNSFI